MRNSFCLFVFSLPMTRTDVRPSYDGQSLIDEDSVAKRRSECHGQPKVRVYKYFAYRPIFFYFRTKIRVL